MAKAKTKTRRVYIKSKRRYHKPKMTIPIAVIAGFAPLVINTTTWVKDLGWQVGVGNAASTLIGYNYATGTWNWANLRFGLGPIALGMLVSKLASRFGLNKMLARTKLPLRL